MGADVAVFIGTFENKLDRKGRISVPSQFRQVLAGQSYHGIVVFRSYRGPAIEGCGYDFMLSLNEGVGAYALFSDAHDDLSASLFADARQLPFDGDGRVILPQEFCRHAGITDRACFVGKGSTFQIWQPEALAQHLEEARQRARSQGLTLPLPGAGRRPGARAGDGGGPGGGPGDGT